MSRRIGVAYDMRAAGGLVQLLLLLFGVALSSRVLDQGTAADVEAAVSSKPIRDLKKEVADSMETLGDGGLLPAAAGAPPKPTRPRGKQKKVERKAVVVQSEPTASDESAQTSGQRSQKSRKKKTASSEVEATTVESEAAVLGENGDDEDEDDAEGILGAADSDWVAFKAALLEKLAAANESLTAGRLGHELHALKGAVAAALWQLKEAGVVSQSEESVITPKWSAVPGAVVDAKPSVAPRFSYDEAKKKKRPGPKGSKEDFETLKLLVRKSIASKGANGSTARALGYALKVPKRVINAALYSCEKEGTAWMLTEKGNGTKPRWGATDASCEKPMPKCYSRAAPFARLKQLLWGVVPAEGGDGVTSGALGYSLGANRKPITAALYSLETEGVVKNIAGERSKAKWVSVVKPPLNAARTTFPMRFVYRGRNASEAAVRRAPGVKVART